MTSLLHCSLLIGLLLLIPLVVDGVPVLKQTQIETNVNGTIKNEKDPPDYEIPPSEHENVANRIQTNDVNSTLITERNFSGEGFKSNLTIGEVRALQGARMLQIMDFKADPCDDFYQFACGNWENHNPLPPDAVGLDTFEKLRDNLNFIMRNLLQEDVESNEGSAIVKAKRLYKSCMDLETIEKRKETPLLNIINELGGWPLLGANQSNQTTNYTHWVDVMAKLRLLNNDILISMWIGPDGKNSEHHIIQLDQGDLALPSRGYYVGSDNQTSVFRAYANFIHATALALGGNESIVDKDVTDLLGFEIELAMILIPAEDRRNFSAMYRKMTIAELKEITSSIPWERYLKGVFGDDLSLDQPVVVYALDYLTQLGDLLNRTNDRTILNYMMWRFVRHRLNNLNQRFQDLKQHLHAVLYGKRQQPERWKYCVSYVNGIMGMSVGSLFVRRFFHEESKNDTTFLISEVQEVFKDILQEVDWLDYETKESAIEKLQAMSLKVGHPSYILNDTALDAEYEEVMIEEDKYFENVLRLLQFLTKEEVKRLHRKVDREMWTTTPAVVNAYYSRTRNQIMLPAGILQPPFYHTHFPKALNYGGIGVVIGHEITHGFDDQGRQYDWRGNLRSWWPIDTAERFEEKAQCIIEQYGNYTTRIDGNDVAINGINTQGENIADNGGVRQAFKAYERWLDSTPDALESEYLPGLNLTAQQLFFVGFGQVWCGTMRPEAAFSKLKTSVHAPGRFRVIGSLSNFEEFSRAFECSEDSKMNPVNRCVVW